MFSKDLLSLRFERTLSGRFSPLSAPLRSRSSVFWNVHSPLRSHLPDFLPALLRFPLQSHALIKATKQSKAKQIIVRNSRRLLVTANRSHVACSNSFLTSTFITNLPRWLTWLRHSLRTNRDRLSKEPGFNSRGEDFVFGFQDMLWD